MEQDPFAVIEALTIAGFATGAERGYLYIRGEYPLARPSSCTRRSSRRAPPDCSANVLAVRVRLRHRAPARGGRLHLWRGDRPVQLDRGQARRAAEQAPVPRDTRRVRSSDRDQQRRDADQRAADPDARRGLVRQRRHRGLDRARGCSVCRSRRAARGVRDPHGVTLGEAIEAAGGVRAGAIAQGGPARRCGGRVCRARSARRATDVRGRSRGRVHARLGRHDGLRRDGPTSSTSACGSRGSSATSPAASACRAASGPFARRRRCTGWSTVARSALPPTSSRCSQRRRRR